VHHIVVCWLKEDAGADAAAKLIDASRTFREIPGVTSVKAGRMLPSERPIVDTTFDVAIVMTFPSVEAMKAYIAHPVHRKAVEEILKPVAQRVVVYDFLIE
jgi:hypothetical protein